MRASRHRRPAPCALQTLELRVLLTSYFVDPAGSDFASGSASAPFQTLQHAADRVRPGDVVTVRPGNYAGFALGWNFPQGGTAPKRITFQAMPGAIIDEANPYTEDGIDLEGASY